MTEGRGAYALFEEVEFVQDERSKAHPIRQPSKGAHDRLHPQRACLAMPTLAYVNRLLTLCPQALTHAT
jgi:hypothetical protein